MFMFQDVQVLLEVTKCQGTHIAWMKEHSADIEQPETSVLRLVKKWDVTCKKLESMRKKLKTFSPTAEVSLSVVNTMAWLMEAEIFLRVHKREKRLSHEVLKIKVDLSADRLFPLRFSRRRYEAQYST